MLPAVFGSPPRKLFLTNVECWTVLLGCVSNARTGRFFRFNGTFKEKCVAREKLQFF